MTATCLFVARIPDNTSDAHLHDALEPIADHYDWHITRCYVATDRVTGEQRSFGFVTFEHGDDCSKGEVLTAVQDAQPAIRDVGLDVQISRPKLEKTPCEICTLPTEYHCPGAAPTHEECRERAARHLEVIQGTNAS